MIRLLTLLTVSFFGALLVEVSISADSISDQAKKLHFSSIVVDTHDDTTQRFFTKDFDIGSEMQPVASIFPACVKEAWARFSFPSGLMAASWARQLFKKRLIKLML